MDDAVLHLALGHLRVLHERERHVVEDVDRVEERCVLVDHPELLPDLVERSLRQADDVVPIDEELAARRLLERYDEPKESGLPRARAANDDRRLAAPGNKVDPLQNLRLAVALADVAKHDNVVRRSPAPTGRFLTGRARVRGRHDRRALAMSTGRG